MAKRKRFYEIEYSGGGPAYVEDAGHLLKISGILLQGMEQNILLLSPSADAITESGLPVVDDLNLEWERPNLELWCAILRQSDDPLIFQEDETGTVKAIVRKQQYAISGAIQQQIWVRDGCRCLYCGLEMGQVQLTIDHWVPLELNGKNDPTNYVSACRQCNKRKGKMDPVSYCKKHGLDHAGIEHYLHGRAPINWIYHLTNL